MKTNVLTFAPSLLDRIVRLQEDHRTATLIAAQSPDPAVREYAQGVAEQHWATLTALRLEQAAANVRGQR